MYLSPWDRNHAAYGTPEYITYFRNQLQELTTEYGELFEVWFDGANGGDGYYGGTRETRKIDRKTYYGWGKTYRLVRANQPNAVIFGSSADVRWVGNEKGIAGNPCWATIDPDLLQRWDHDEIERTDDMVAAWGSPRGLLNVGDRWGNAWMPAECDVSIRPGWFYHAAEDDKVRPPENLVDLYFQSVGRGASLLLNLPPDRRGLIHETDAANLLAFRRQLDEMFGNDLAKGATCTASNTRGNNAAFAPANVIDGNPETYWATDGDAGGCELTLDFPEPVTFNVIGLHEYLPVGQRIDRFAIDIDDGGTWCEWCCEAAIGAHRLIRGETSTTRQIRFRVVEAPVCPAIAEFGLYAKL